jgi:hypothetical protein
VKEAQEREKNIMEEKVGLEEKLNYYLSKEEEANKNNIADHQNDVIE